jgi:HSP20 family protein
MYRIVRYSQPRTACFRVPAPTASWAGLEQEIDRLFQGSLAPLAAPARIPIEVREGKGDSYVVRAELPGVKREDIALEIVADRLTIRATRRDGEQASELSRAFDLPAGVPADKIGATLADGVLTVTVPKPEQAKPRTIAIH